MSALPYNTAGSAPQHNTPRLVPVAVHPRWLLETDQWPSSVGWLSRDGFTQRPVGYPSKGSIVILWD